MIKVNNVCYGTGSVRTTSAENPIRKARSSTTIYIRAHSEDHRASLTSEDFSYDTEEERPNHMNGGVIYWEGYLAIKI